MDLFFKRSETNGRRVSFRLWAKIELTSEEQDLVRIYRMASARLDHVYDPHLWKLALGVGVLAFFGSQLLFVILAVTGLLVFLPMPIQVGATVLIAIGSGFWFYHAKRETIYVKDLMHGRYFRCRSVIVLARKEAYLQTISAYLRQVLESAKHWDGTERFEIEALPPAEAKRLILSGPIL